MRIGDCIQQYRKLAMRLTVLVIAIGAAAGQPYAVVDLGPSAPARPGVNASNQVAGTTGSRAFFFNGTVKLDLGTLGGSFSEATAFNGAGQVVGISSVAGDAAYHAFSWTAAGGMVDLGTLGGNLSYPLWVTEAGQVIGYSEVELDEPRVHPFYWTAAGGMVDAGTLGGSNAVPLGASDTGQIVGWSYLDGDEFTHAFSWTPSGGIVDLGTLGGTDSIATVANGAGMVAGYSGISPGDGTQHGFVWTQAGGMVDIGSLGGGHTEPTAITAAGQVVGHSNLPGDSVFHAFSWTSTGGMADLGTLGESGSYAVAVNPSGQVICSTYALVPGGGAARQGFSWTQAGGAIGLGTLGGAATEPVAISPAGIVVGFAERAGGGTSGFSWTQSGGLVDLNTLLPAGTDLRGAVGVASNGSIIGYAGTSLVLLRNAVVTAPAAVAALMGEVNSAPLTAAEKQSLNAKLESALRSLEKGNATAAVNQLNAFLNQLRALETSGRLSAAAAEALRTQANAAIALIG